MPALLTGQFNISSQLQNKDLSEEKNSSRTKTMYEGETNKEHDKSPIQNNSLKHS